MCADSCTSCSNLMRSSPVTAARSSIATGALRWLSPTTSRLMWCHPARSQLDRLDVLAFYGPPGLALLVEREDLQFDRQIDLTHVDAFRHGQNDGCEVEHPRTTRRAPPAAQ